MKHHGHLLGVGFRDQHITVVEREHATLGGVKNTYREFKMVCNRSMSVEHLVHN